MLTHLDSDMGTLVCKGLREVPGVFRVRWRVGSMVGRRNNTLLASSKPQWQKFKAGPRTNDYFTDLAVRVGDVATAAKMRIMASLQRSAAEPVDTKVLF